MSFPKSGATRTPWPRVNRERRRRGPIRLSAIVGAERCRATATTVLQAAPTLRPRRHRRRTTRRRRRVSAGLEAGPLSSIEEHGRPTASRGMSTRRRTPTSIEPGGNAASANATAAARPCADSAIVNSKLGRKPHDNTDKDPPEAAPEAYAEAAEATHDAHDWPGETAVKSVTHSCDIAAGQGVGHAPGYTYQPLRRGAAIFACTRFRKC